MLRDYLIICPLVFIAGYIDAVAGGGGLVSLPAYMLTGIPVHQCVATNKMSAFMGTSVATAKYARSGFIPIKIAAMCIPCALTGSALGAKCALMVPDGIFKIVMVIIIPLTGIYILTRKNGMVSKREYTAKATIPVSMAIAFAIGLYDGFYGPGTGTFLILLLTGVAGMELSKANGLTKAINVSTNISALVVFLINGQVIFPLGLIAGAFNIAGNYLGAAGFEKKGAVLVKPVMLLVLSVFFVKILIEIFCSQQL